MNPPSQAHSRTALQPVGGANDPPLAYIDPSLDSVLDALDRAAANGAPVCLVGEMGTGKRLAARAIHRASRATALMRLPVRSLPVAELMKRFEELLAEPPAQPATCWVDGLDRASEEVQLVVAEAVDRSSASLRFDGASSRETRGVRWMATLRGEPTFLQQRGTLLPELSYVFAGQAIALPALRSRLLDLEPLVAELTGRLAGGYALAPPRWSSGAMRRLAKYRWPGNIRELRSVVEGALLRAESGTVGTRQLDWFFGGCLPERAEECPDGPRLAKKLEFSQGGQETGVAFPLSPGGGDPRSADVGLGYSTLAEVEARTICEALNRHDGHRRRTAESLGIGERTLYTKLRVYGLTVQKSD